MRSQPSEAVVWLDRALGTAAAVLLFCLMALTTADVVGRYIFNWPIRGAFEITELLLLTLIFAGLPLASRADENEGGQRRKGSERKEQRATERQGDGDCHGTEHATFDALQGHERQVDERRNSAFVRGRKPTA